MENAAEQSVDSRRKGLDLNVHFIVCNHKTIITTTLANMHNRDMHISFVNETVHATRMFSIRSELTKLIMGIREHESTFISKCHGNSPFDRSLNED